MPHIHNPQNVPAPIGGYSQAVEIKPNARYLFISGQIPETASGDVPTDFEGQCHQVWQNIIAILNAADMSATNLVHVRTYLTSREQAWVNGEIRRHYLNGHAPALTVIVAQTLESPWLLEIEAVAAVE